MQPDLGPILLILAWVKWIALAICLASIMIAAGRLATAYTTGEQVHSMRSILLVLVAATIISAAAQIASMLL